MQEFNQSITKAEIIKYKGSNYMLELSTSLFNFDIEPKLELYKTYRDFELYLGEKGGLYSFGIFYLEPKKRLKYNGFDKEVNLGFIKDETELDLVKVSVVSIEGFKSIGYITLDWANALIPSDCELKKKNMEYVIIKL